jgi:hypothetical protein
VSELNNVHGLRQILIFGGFDPYTIRRIPRFLNTFEQYDGVMKEWNFPGKVKFQPRELQDYIIH